ncbi:hypothetical protein DLJ53_32960 [Acuticoccus sediminis]|uniref:Uncharacterized protein n=1 Tax=Acuticoccus sediminis TaxID=2184697 RepID=A0A8B2NCU4_9HYPH|nr:hypothetical protein DLJ53_32960 [Acuticoccus sediminis]
MFAASANGRCGGAHRGWICIDIEDLGTPDTPDAVCEMCERQETVLREGARRLLAQAVEAEAAIGLAIMVTRPSSKRR